MPKAVFATRIHPSYDDLPEERYHFPRTYLNAVNQAVGDWIVYYEPSRVGAGDSSRGGRKCYFATARIREVIPDHALKDHYYALMSDYIEFPRPVPFREGGQFFESGLKKTDGSMNKGSFRRAVRLLADHEYETICQCGFLSDDILTAGLAPSLTPEPEVADRPTIQTILDRPFRDRAFTTVVRTAYDATCAMTGVKLINGGGLCEIEAAHIRPVAECGPDSPRNGIALSRTVHWMFDRGIVSAEDDGTIITAKRLIPDPVKRMLNPEGRLLLPKATIFRPHPQFLRYHRENVFKG